MRMAQEATSDFTKEPLLLEQQAIIAVASQICDVHLPNIKEQLQQYKILPTYLHDELLTHLAKSDYSQRIKMEISETVLVKLKPLLFPDVIKVNIRTKLLELIDLLYDWISFVIGRLKLDIAYVDEVYWTPRGEINIDKILMCNWLNVPASAPCYRKWFYVIFKPKHYLPCLFAQEDLVRNFQTEIVKEIKFIFPRLDLGRNLDPVFRIISIIIFCFHQCVAKRHYGAIPIDQLSERNLTAVNILSLCRYYDLHKAFIYFFNNLNAIDQVNYLERMSQSFFAQPSILCGPYDLYYKSENKFQIVNFLINKMNNSQKENFQINNFYFMFLNYLTKESYHKFCIPLAEKFLIPKHSLSNHIEPFRYESILYHVIQILRKNVTDFGLDPRFHVQVLEFLVKNIPVNFKILCIPYNYRNSTLYYAYDTFCIPALRAIISDPDLQSYKYQMIKIGKMKFKSLIEGKNYKALDQFQNQVLISKRDQDIFDKIFSDHIFELWMSDCRFDFIENYLNWKHGERARIFKICYYPLWASCVPKYYITIKKLLMWSFDKQEMPSVNDCRHDQEIMALKRFCQELIYNIWFGSKIVFNSAYTHSGANLSRQILSSVFEYEMDIRDFKKYELAKDESCVKFLCTNALKNPYRGEARFEAIDEFFKFCGLPYDKVAEIKQSIRENLRDWIVRFGVSVKRFDIVFPLLDWVNGKEADNCRIIKIYFSNPDAVDAYFHERKFKEY